MQAFASKRSSLLAFAYVVTLYCTFVCALLCYAVKLGRTFVCALLRLGTRFGCTRITPDTKAINRAIDCPVVLLPGNMGDVSLCAAELRRRGIHVVTPPLGPVSSCHDRACEIFYALKGGPIDFGEAHARAHGHARWARGSSHGAMLPGWDAEHPVIFALPLSATECDRLRLSTPLIASLIRSSCSATRKARIAHCACSSSSLRRARSPGTLRVHAG